MKKTQKGFSLIELLIVVAIILVIAAIAVPNLLKARMAANEASAVASVRTINTAQASYQSSWGQYAGSLATLGGPSNASSSTSAGLIDASLASATTGGTPKAGYTFVLSASTNGAYYLTTGNPSAFGSTGLRSFCSDETSSISQLNPGNSTGLSNTAPTAPGSCSALSGVKAL